MTEHAGSLLPNDLKRGCAGARSPSFIIILLFPCLNSMRSFVLKIGLVGAGYLGTRHLNHLTTLEGVSVPAIWDSDPNTLLEASTKYNVPRAESLNHLLRLSDALVCVTTTSSHFEVGMAAVSAGIPLFIEKPVCATVEEGKRLVEAAERQSVSIQIGHIERFNRAFRALDQVKVRPRFVEAHRLAQWKPRGADVAVILDLMIHDLDLLLTLSGEFPDHIHASGVGVMSPSIDIANARLEFPSGLVANVTASRISLKQMRKLRLFGQQEYVALDMGKGTCEYVGGDMTGAVLPEGTEILGDLEFGQRHLKVFRRFIEAPEGDAMRLELSAFRDMVVNGSAPVISAEAGLKALQLAELVIDRIKGK